MYKHDLLQIIIYMLKAEVQNMPIRHQNRSKNREAVSAARTERKNRLSEMLMILMAAVLLLSVPGLLNGRGQKEPDTEKTQEVQGSSSESEVQTDSEESGTYSMLPLRPDHKFAVLQGWNVKTGKEVNSGILGRNEATIINIWATTCPACMQELPKLAELKPMLPDGAGILGISLDAAQRPEDALAVLDRFGITYTTISPHPSIEELLYETAPYIPATVIVDKNGKILSGPHYGVKENAFFLDELESLGIFDSGISQAKK
jgi:thiol-disulfide isomerase/thioredoxin